MSSGLLENLNTLNGQDRLKSDIVLWGIGRFTDSVLDWFEQHKDQYHIICIVDNFKYTFQKKYRDIPVERPYILNAMDKDSFSVVLSVDYATAIRKQLNAMDIFDIFNLRNLDEKNTECERTISWHFKDRSKGKETLCYVLAGYEPLLWDNTLKRMELFQSADIDYCIISSGKYVEEMDRLAERNNWSYLYTEQNQVCLIQNLVVELHPNAQYIIKMDEDIFIGRHFFEDMLYGFKHIEKDGEYRIGFAVPVIPLNCCSYVSYLKLTGRKKEYEEQFGRAYKSRFSAVFNVEDTATYLWSTMDSFDQMAEYFRLNKNVDILNCYYNIGCIMFTRERWIMMGKWPEVAGESGMGRDERYICNDNNEKDMPIYEIQSVLAGHLAFGHQKDVMRKFYNEHQEIFAINTME